MNSKEIIDQLYTGNLVKVREAFEEAMKPELANILATKRLDVAATMLGDQVVSEELLDELSKKTLGSYVNKAITSKDKADSMGHSTNIRSMVHRERGNKERADEMDKKTDKHMHTYNKRTKGIERTMKKMRG